MIDTKTYEKLYNHMIKIPTMTDLDGREELREAASKVRPGRNIVEVGAWLGACTVFLAAGILQSGNKNPLHVYDNFVATNTEKEKADKQGVSISANVEYINLFDSHMAPLDNLGVKITKHVCNIKTCKWAGGKIGLYVDDAAKKKTAFNHVMKTFYPYFMPGETILFLMDYYFYERKTEKSYEYQKFFMESHKKNFKFIKRIGDSCNAVFLYTGGSLW